MSDNSIPKAPNPYASGGHKEPLAEQTRGKKYRVRNDKPEPDKVWGKDLDFAAAHKLKEQVAGGRKSKSVIIEPMEVAHGAVAAQPNVGAAPSDPILRAQYDAGLSAARGAAAEAQARADAAAVIKAKQDAAAQMLAAAQAAQEQTAALLAMEDPGGELDDGALSDLLADEGQMPTDDEIADAGDPTAP